MSSDTEDEIDVEPFFDACCEVFSTYIGLFNAPVGRIAGVVTKFSREATPVAALAHHFCKNEWFGGGGAMEAIDDFELSAAAQTKLKAFSVNSGIRCRLGFLIKPGSAPVMQSGPPRVLIEVDINTKDEPAASHFQSEQISEFYALLPAEMDRKVAHFVPGGTK